MSYSFDRGLTWTCLGAALALAACGGATSSPETVKDASAADGKTTSHDSGSKTDTGTKSDAKTTPDAKTTTPDAKTTEDTGATTDAAGCPATAPADRAACTTTGEACSYTVGGDTTDCTCAGGMIGWFCHSCPTTQPTAGAACTAMGGGGMGGGGGAGGGEACTYGTTDCACTAGAWNCGTCPASEPTAGDSCTLPGELCTYAAGDCRCGGGGGKKVDAGAPTDGGATDGAVMGNDGGGMTAPTEAWRCGDPCPATEPMTGAACTTLQGEACKYGTTSCDCLMGKFACN